MSDVLRKKINSATGVPRTVLQMGAFWDGLRAICADWSFEVFDTQIRPLFEERRVISGKAVRELLDEGTSYLYPTDSGSGLAAIRLLDDCANAYVSRRLQSGSDTAESAPPLFLKLICEEPASTLRLRITQAFEGLKDPGILLPTEDFRAVAGMLDPHCRYLIILVRFPFPDRPVQVRLIFALDDILKLSARQSKAASDRLAHVYRQTPETLRRSARTSEIEIDAVLGQLKMSIGDCSRLQVGQVLSFVSEKHGQVTLTAETLSGAHIFGKGMMGTWKQNRAVRVVGPVSPIFLQNSADLEVRANTL